MKNVNFEALLIAAKPIDYPANNAFTDSVMKKIQDSEILSSAVRNMDVNKKETFIMKLRHLPKFGLIALIVGSFLLLTGTTYAVVKTVEHFNNIQLNTTNTNDFGRQQLSISFDGCRDSRKDVTYELKKGGNLSTEDGVKTLQARCDMDTIDTWFTEIEPIEFGRPFYMNRMDTVTSINDKTVSFETASPVTLQQNSKVLSDNKEIALSQLKVGDTVYVYPDYSSSIPNNHPLRIFVVSQAQKYYGLDYQSYVNERGPCTGNKTLTCLSASNINHTVLMITFGGGINDPRIGQSYRVAQGRVVSYDNKTITLDVGKGVTYTVQTPSNILDTFNNKTVFGLADIDAIYAGTKPEDLMVKKGDSLEITYLGDDADISTNLQWSDIIGVQLMVERIPDNLDVLRKY